MSVKSYRDMVVWQKAMALVVECYRLAGLLPKKEAYGLVSQIQRAAVSVRANVAEGHGRDHLGDYLHHLSIANGSLMELETHLLLLPRLSYLSADELETSLRVTDEGGKMISGLSKSLKPTTS